MTGTRNLRARWLLALLAAGALPGCVAAAAAAGAGTGIYLTTRGAESVIEGSPSDVAGRVRSVLREEGITINATSSEDGGDKQEFKGAKGDLDVTVTVQRQSSTTTKVEVTARENLAEWDKQYAQRILNRVVAKE
ncbi:MAG TPA: hypothetical protein VFM14_06400 [Gemmatimonadales bacterium]|nr:hypothetical protein [Gemmatimonadales bacterium]